MNLTDHSAFSLSWLITEAIISLVAASGGIIVFWGLWLEKRAVKDRYSDVTDFRESKQKAEFGWKVLMVGIAIEIIVGFAFAAKDGWEIRQIETRIARNDPLKQPISDVSALAFIEVRDGDSKEQSIKAILPDSVSWVAYLTTLNSNREPTSVVSGLLVADRFTKIALGGSHGPTADRGYSLLFHLDDLGLRERGGLAEKINDISMLAINVFFLSTNAEVFGGRVKLIVNSQVQKTFSVLPQKGFAKTAFDVGVSILASNSTQPTLVFDYDK